MPSMTGSSSRRPVAGVESTAATAARKTIAVSGSWRASSSPFASSSSAAKTRRGAVRTAGVRRHHARSA